MEYNGYKYERFDDVEYGDEGVEHSKYDHVVTTPEGSIVRMDWSPYQRVTEEDFRLWVDSGMPTRIGVAPLDHETLLEAIELMRIEEDDLRG